MAECRSEIATTYTLRLSEEEMISVYTVLGALDDPEKTKIRTATSRIWHALDRHIVADELQYPRIKTMVLNMKGDWR